MFKKINVSSYLIILAFVESTLISSEFPISTSSGCIHLTTPCLSNI